MVIGRFDVILTIGAGAARAAKRATDSVPIVFCSMGDDPVQLGMVATTSSRSGETRRPTSYLLARVGSRIDGIEARQAEARLQLSLCRG